MWMASGHAVRGRVAWTAEGFAGWIRWYRGASRQVRGERWTSDELDCHFRGGFGEDVYSGGGKGNQGGEEDGKHRKRQENRAW